MDDVRDWKLYLSTKGLYKGAIASNDIDLAFRKGMRELEEALTEKIPSVLGMIWQKGQINPNASIMDVEEALKLSRGVANFDALGPPDAPDHIGSPFNQMFISQEDSKSDEWDPRNNQNQGAWQSDIPQKSETQNKQKQHKNSPPVKNQMERLIELIEMLKK